MTYKFDFGTLPFRVGKPIPYQPELILDADIEYEHTRVYIRRKMDTLPENCTAVFHTSDGDWLELDVGSESIAGQREMPEVKILSIDRM